MSEISAPNNMNVSASSRRSGEVDTSRMSFMEKCGFGAGDAACNLLCQISVLQTISTKLFISRSQNFIKAKSIIRPIQRAWLFKSKHFVVGVVL